MREYGALQHGGGNACIHDQFHGVHQLLRIFGGDRMRAIADKLRLEEGEAIESKMLTRMIESAQRKVEGRNYDIRKQLLEFDDVQNDQRHEIYGLRNQILESEDISELVKNLREGMGGGDKNIVEADDEEEVIEEVEEPVKKTTAAKKTTTAAKKKAE